MRVLYEWFSRRNVWTRRLVLLVAGTVAAGVILWFTPTSYYITAPGAAIDTSRMVKVPGGEAHPDRLYMLVVTTQPANLLLYLYAKADRRAELETPEQYLGGVENYQEYLKLNQRMMSDSQQTAKAIGLQLAGYGKGVTRGGAEVAGLVENSPSKGFLQEEDVIVEVAGQPVRSTEDLRNILKATAPGTPLSLKIRRQSKELSLTVPTIEHSDPTRKGTAALGIYIADSLEFDIPLAVEIKSGAITGPSAGMMFTLQIVDQLTPGGISGGKRFAGTGTVQPDGKVGAIGGVKQKVYTAEAMGAEVIFVPRANFDDARSVATRIEVVAVDRVADALEWLRSHKGTASQGKAGDTTPAFWP